MKRGDVFLATGASVIAAAFIATGAGRLPTAGAESSARRTAPGAPTLTPALTPALTPTLTPTLTPPLATAAATVALERPRMVYNVTVLAPIIVRAKRAVVREAKAEIRAVHGKFERAASGETLRVSLTQYCLKGYTRRENYVRLGIVASDPRVFPLARFVEVTLGGRHLGRFLVDDTGGNVKGPTLDIWNPSCREARRFGRQWGTATLVSTADEESEPITRTFESPPQP